MVISSLSTPWFRIRTVATLTLRLLEIVTGVYDIPAWIHGMSFYRRFTAHFRAYCVRRLYPCILEYYLNSFVRSCHDATKSNSSYLLETCEWRVGRCSTVLLAI